MTPTKTHRQFDGDTARKAVLYCPDCGHESPIGGDWRVESSGIDRERVVYACPVCERVVTTRPAHGLVSA